MTMKIKDPQDRRTIETRVSFLFQNTSILENSESKYNEQ